MTQERLWKSFALDWKKCGKSACEAESSGGLARASRAQIPGYADAAGCSGEETGLAGKKRKTLGLKKDLTLKLHV